MRTSGGILGKISEGIPGGDCEEIFGRFSEKTSAGISKGNSV